MIQNLRIIFDLGENYSEHCKNEFKEYMKLKGFWPDINDNNLDEEK
jgi:hypothetical protein